MGQQPNIELGLEDRPREDLGTAPPRRWRPDRPGIITAPQQVPKGVEFGRPGPDSGFARKLIEAATLPDEVGLADLLERLMTTRAGTAGRAPSAQDLEAALVLTGLDQRLPSAARLEGDRRRRRWLAGVAHEKVKGRTALAEIEPVWWTLPVEELRSRVSR